MNRRSFIKTLSAASAQKKQTRAASQTGLVLEAIAAPDMPARLTLDGAQFVTWGKPSLIELRRYHPAPPDPGLFKRAGMTPQPFDAQTHLIPFKNLNERQAAWNRFNADPAWIASRHLSATRSISLWTPCQPAK